MNTSDSIAYIQSRLGNSDGFPKIGLILGSGLGGFANEVEDAVYILTNDIPNYPVSTVEGHEGYLVFGKSEGVNLVIAQGRVHYYEGYTLQEVTYPIQLMAQLGVETLIITNSCGGISQNFIPGDLMFIEDIINLMFSNPLIGPNDDESGPRFPDMSQPFDHGLIEIAESTALGLGIRSHRGTYCGVLGPSYETAAEIRMIAYLGGDVVGMSTIPEVVLANHRSIKVLGISCITNQATGIQMIPLSHDEVMETANRVKNAFIEFMRKVIQQINLLDLHTSEIQ